MINYETTDAQTFRKLLGIGSFSAAASSLAYQTSEAEVIQANINFMAGDYLQAGKQFSFSGPVEEMDNAGLTTIERELATVPLVQGIVKRHRRGVMGREPSWEFTVRRSLEEDEKPSDDEQKAIGDISAPLTSFWEKRSLHDLAQNSVSQLDVTGEFAWRIFPRSSAINKSGIIKRMAKADDAYDILYVELLDYGTVSSYLDRHTMREIIGFEYSEDETGEGGNVAQVKRLVVTYLDDQKRAVVRSWKGEVEDPLQEPYELNGELPIKLVRRKPLIDLPIQKIQGQITKTVTMMGLNNNLQGFVQLIATNLLPPGGWESTTDADNNTVMIYRENDDEPIGPGMMSFLNSAAQYNPADKSWTFAPSGGVTRIEPIDPDYLIKCLRYLEEMGLKAADQDHTLITGDATASAVSRIESRAQFIWSLLETKVVMESALRWLLETLAYMAAHFGPESAVTALAPFRARVDVHASGGPLAPDERRATIEAYQAGLVARETAITTLGTEDIDAEIALLEKDPNYMLEKEKLKAELFEVWSRIFDTNTAAQLAKLDEEQLEILKTAKVNDDDEEDKQRNPAVQLAQAA
jgi:hypothetical protein